MAVYIITYLVHSVVCGIFTWCYLWCVFRIGYSEEPERKKQQDIER